MIIKRLTAYLTLFIMIFFHGCAGSTQAYAKETKPDDTTYTGPLQQEPCMVQVNLGVYVKTSSIKHIQITDGGVVYLTMPDSFVLELRFLTQEAAFKYVSTLTNNPLCS